VFPFIDTAPRAKPPVVVLALIAANFAVFLWMQGLPPRMLEATLVHYALIPLRYTDPRLAVSVGLDPSNWMPMLTDMFMHGGWMHIIGNMVFLWAFGPEIEDAMGPLRYLIFYLLGGIVAFLAQVAAMSDSTVPNLGASGAIAAVMGAFLITYPRDQIRTLLLLGWFVTVTVIPAAVLIGIWFLLQLFSQVGSVGEAQSSGGVAYMAHVAGLIFGAVMARFFEDQRRIAAQSRNWVP
jgi:membrane associated rhomboid family serine protease